MGEVETTAGVIPDASSVANVLAATPGWLFIPAPITETLPRSSRALQSAASASSVWRASALASTGAEKAVSGPVWTIVSTLAAASAGARKGRWGSTQL